MPTLNLVTEITIDDLLFVVSKLSQAEFFQFELGLVKLKQARLDMEAAQIAAAHRLPLTKQARLSTLLEKNQESNLTQAD